jgi:hypothetical protein
MACVRDVDLCTLVSAKILKESAASGSYPVDIGYSFLKNVDSY